MNLVEDLGVDSLSKCELAIALERVFDIRLSDDDAEQIQTFGDAVSMVQRRLA
jgi:acyl carrier protein